MGCGFKVAKEEPATSEQGPRTSFSLVPGSSIGGSSLDAVLQDRSQFKGKLSTVKMMLVEEKVLNVATRICLLSSLPSPPHCHLLLRNP